MRVNTAGSVQTQNAASSGGMEIGSDEFLKLLITQMQHQDPLSPMEGTEFMSQLSQLQSVSTLEEISSQLSASNKLAGPLNMLGRTVSYLDDSGIVQTGTVSAITRAEDSSFLLTIDEAVIDMSQVLRVE
ncbi:MAG: flagellar hook assembly protein FlgD [Armatimonadota bacterium]